MTNVDPLGPWIRLFLLEYLISERNQSRNTQASYRDTLTLLIPFVGAKLRRPIDQRFECRACALVSCYFGTNSRLWSCNS